jgi:hypothetical protein
MRDKSKPVKLVEAEIWEAEDSMEVSHILRSVMGQRPKEGMTEVIWHEAGFIKNLEKIYQEKK